MPPERLLKYLARYVGGGPISDSRFVRWGNGHVTFLARRRDDEPDDQQLSLFPDSDQTPESSTRSTSHSPLPTSHCSGINLPLSVTKTKTEITISESEFVRRWAIHILPRGFMRVQHYGATSRRKGTEYLAQCRQLLGIDNPDVTDSDDSNASAENYGAANSSAANSSVANSDPSNLDASHCGAANIDSKTPMAEGLENIFKLTNEIAPEEKPYEPTWKCTQCGKRMECLEFQLRPSWRVVFERLNQRTDTDTQLRLWTANELHEMRYTKMNPAILDSS